MCSKTHIVLRIKFERSHFYFDVWYTLASKDWIVSISLSWFQLQTCVCVLSNKGGAFSYKAGSVYYLCQKTFNSKITIFLIYDAKNLSNQPIYFKSIT